MRAAIWRRVCVRDLRKARFGGGFSRRHTRADDCPSTSPQMTLSSDATDMHGSSELSRLSTANRIDSPFGASTRRRRRSSVTKDKWIVHLIELSDQRNLITMCSFGT